MLLSTKGLNINLTVVGEIDKELKNICKKEKPTASNYWRFNEFKGE